jgi:hypothetical protein
VAQDRELGALTTWWVFRSAASSWDGFTGVLADADDVAGAAATIATTAIRPVNSFDLIPATRRGP